MAITNRGKFKFVFKFILENEGAGYLQPNKSKFGISLTNFPTLKYYYDIKELNLNQAESLHQRLLWEKYNFASIKNIELSAKIYDLLIFLGLETGFGVLEEALKQMNYENPKSMKLNVNILNQIDKNNQSKKFLETLISISLNQYQSITTSNEKRIKNLPTS